MSSYVCERADGPELSGCFERRYDSSALNCANLFQSAEAPQSLERTLHREPEERPDQLVVLLDEQDRIAVAEAAVDIAIEQVAAVEDVVDREADFEPQHVLVLDIEA